VNALVLATGRGKDTQFRGERAAFAPLVTGAAFTVAALGVPFFASGAIKIVYDVLVYATFKDVRPPEEEERRLARLERQTQAAVW